MPFINDKLEYYAKQKQTDVKQAADTEVKQNIKKEGIQSRFKFNVDEIMIQLQGQIFGQERAMNALENMLKIVRADISDPEKPLYVGLFLGPTGVGKTEIVRVLAKAIHGDRNKFCRVDMNTLSQDHYAAALTGAPPGYVGSKEGSTILDKELIEGTYSKPGIILFDEIEKASSQVIQTLLNIFDNGIMTITSGEETLDFRNTIIIMTSNLGARDMYRYANNRFSFLFQKILYYLSSKEKDHKEINLLDQIINNNLEKTFKPEFINRIDDIIIFNWLDTDVITQIIAAYLDEMNKKLSKYNCTLKLEPSAIDFLNQKGFDKRYGGRALKRALRQYLEVPLAELLIERHDSEQELVIVAERSSNNRHLSVSSLVKD